MQNPGEHEEDIFPIPTPNATTDGGDGGVEVVCEGGEGLRPRGHAAPCLKG